MDPIPRCGHWNSCYAIKYAFCCYFLPTYQNNWTICFWYSDISLKHLDLQWTRHTSHHVQPVHRASCLWVATLLQYYTQVQFTRFMNISTWNCQFSWFYGRYFWIRTCFYIRLWEWVQVIHVDLHITGKHPAWNWRNTGTAFGNFIHRRLCSEGQRCLLHWYEILTFMLLVYDGA